MGNEMELPARLISMAEFKRMAQAGPVTGVLVRKQYALDEPVVPDPQSEDPVLQFTISTAAVDRDGDTVAPDGWLLDNYRKNPVVQWAHDYEMPPIAKSTAQWVENGALKARAQFTPRDLYPFGFMIYQMYQQGFLKAVSVGFIPRKWQLAQGREGMYPMDITEQELLEFSAVPVPANPEALLDAQAKGIDMQPLVEWAEKVLDLQKGSRAEASAAAQARAVLVEPKFISTPVEQKGPISYQRAHANGTPKAPEDEPWDGPAEVAAADQKELHIMCAWYDPAGSDDDGDGWPDQKQAYKLPHHKAGGQHSVVWAGVRAAMSALLGGRGGVNIPEADRQGVYDHLARHYREFDKQPPELRSYSPEECKALLDEGVGVEGHEEPAGERMKAGRVLSSANEDRIRRAKELLDEVLVQLDQSGGNSEAEGAAAIKASEADSEVKTLGFRAEDVDGFLFLIDEGE